MLALAQETPVISNTKYFGPAHILELTQIEGLVLLQIDGLEEALKGRLAVPYTHLCNAGARVLVSGENLNDLYVIGILGSNLKQQAGPQSLVLKNGTIAEITEDSDFEKLQLRTNTGELIFEHNPETGKSRVNLQSGDLEFVTQKGDISFRAAGDIRFMSKQAIEMQSQIGVSLMTTDIWGKILSSLTLYSKKLSFQSPLIGMTAQKADLNIEESNYSGAKFVGRIGHSKLISQKVETLANDIFEKAKTVYRSVEGLTQLRTGRMKTMVEASYHLKSKNAFLKTEEDFKVKAEKIHLG